MKKINLQHGLLKALLFFIFITFQSCVATNSPENLGDYYAENYPSSKKASADSKKHIKNRKIKSKEAPFWQNPKEEKPLNIDQVISVEEDNKDQLKNVLISREDDIVEGKLDSYPDHTYAADDDVIGQNTASMIEGKIFKLIEEAYIKRDYREFIRLYSLFLESFPHSSQKGFLDEKKDNFYYREDLNREQLEGSLVEVTYPEAKTIDELGDYFGQLKDNGVESIQIDVVQFTGSPIYLFSKDLNSEGYYFKNSVGLEVDDLLQDVVDRAHSKGLKIFVAFPLRHHPKLGENSLFILDETWNAFQNRTSPNSKLDIINEDGQAYLFRLVGDLLHYQIDGIVFKDDFTYEVNEGFSEAALDSYMSRTGRPFLFNKMFVPTSGRGAREFEIITGDDFDDVALWRTQEVKQFLWDLVEFVKVNRPDLQVGLELTAEMILEELDPVKWYSTGMKFLKDLNTDLMVLKWRKFQSERESDPVYFETAAKELRSEVSADQSIYLKVPLSQRTKNVIELNRKIGSQVRIKEELSGIKIAVGPVNRMEQLDIVN